MMTRLVLNLLAMGLLTGCVSYPVMEFRGTAVNIDGNGQVETGPRALGSQKTGTTGDNQFFALGFGENAEFRLLYPRGKSLGTVDPSSVKASLIRGPSAPWSTKPASHPEIVPFLTEIELAGPIHINYRDNIHFTISVDLKSKGTNDVRVHGMFLSYSPQEFEPMSYVLTIPLLMGFGYADMRSDPSPVRTHEGNLGLVRQAIRKLSKKRNPGASVELFIVEANRWITFTKNSALVNPTAIRLSFPVNSKQNAALKAKMASVCEVMGLNLKVAASRELSNPTVETEPYFLSVDLHGQVSHVTETIVTILQRLFGVTENSRFRMIK